MNNLNREFDEQWYKSLIKNNPFLKLTYKKDWSDYTKKHKITYYGWLKNKYL